MGLSFFGDVPEGSRGNAKSEKRNRPPRKKQRVYKHKTEAEIEAKGEYVTESCREEEAGVSEARREKGWRFQLATPKETAAAEAIGITANAFERAIEAEMAQEAPSNDMEGDWMRGYGDGQDNN